ncbi:DUF6760 family protein [Micromonospora sp. NBRC 101691]|uniref:DUF6760 family protein n=1 Tax=Micromonospora sp. NBRC 101691 TaxID=3032198 RepID=UPI0033328980
MPALRGRVRGGRGGGRAGGILTYATDQLWEEVAYVAHHLHWSLDSILDLEHPDRVRLLAEIRKFDRPAVPRHPFPT